MLKRSHVPGNLEPWDGEGVQRALQVYLKVGSREGPLRRMLSGDNQERFPQSRKFLLGMAYWTSLDTICTSTDTVLFKARTHTLNSV